MKNFVILGIYMAAMGTGLVFCSQVLGTAYDSPEFGGKFLPFTIFLAVLVLCYGIKNQEDVALHTKNNRLSESLSRILAGFQRLHFFNSPTFSC